MIGSYGWRTDIAGDSVRLPLRHVPTLVRGIYACLVGGVDGPLQGASEFSRLARLDTFEHDLVALHDVIDIEPQVPDGGVAGQLADQARA